MEVPAGNGWGSAALCGDRAARLTQALRLRSASLPPTRHATGCVHRRGGGTAVVSEAASSDGSSLPRPSGCAAILALSHASAAYLGLPWSSLRLSSPTGSPLPATSNPASVETPDPSTLRRGDSADRHPGRCRNRTGDDLFPLARFPECLLATRSSYTKYTSGCRERTAQRMHRLGRHPGIGCRIRNGREAARRVQARDPSGCIRERAMSRAAD